MKKWVPIIGLGLILSFLPIWRDIYGGRNNFWQMLSGNLDAGSTCEHLEVEDAIAKAKVARWTILNVPIPG